MNLTQLKKEMIKNKFNPKSKSVEHYERELLFLTKAKATAS